MNWRLGSHAATLPRGMKSLQAVLRGAPRLSVDGLVFLVIYLPRSHGEELVKNILLMAAILVAYPLFAQSHPIRVQVIANNIDQQSSRTITSMR